MDQPFQLALRIMDLRRYARLKAELDRLRQTEGVDPATCMQPGFEEVWHTEAALNGHPMGGADGTVSTEELAQRRAERELFG